MCTNPKIFLTYNEETLSLKEWSLKTGIPYTTIIRRYIKGYSPETILKVESLSTKKYEDKNETSTRLYNQWSIMRMCCQSESYPSYKNIGGKGIKFADEWNDYLTFKKWAVENGWFEDGYLIRRDLSKDYCPDNCFIGSKNEKMLHTPNSKPLTYDGQTKSLVDWGKERNIRQQTLSIRLKRGWTVGQALEFEERPKMKNKGGYDNR